MKKIISSVLCILMLVPLICITSYADIPSPPGGGSSSGYSYQWDESTGAYFYADFPQKPGRWEFDIMPISYNSEIRSYMGNEFTMSVDDCTIGIGNSTIRYYWNWNEWYHIVADATEGNGTTVISVDGTVVGEVNTAIYERACCGMVNIAVDNLKCSNGYSQNFDNVSHFNPNIGVNDANGRLVQGGAPEHKHNYVTEVIKAATCTEDGQSRLTCQSCGNTFTKTALALGHKWVCTEMTAPTYRSAGSLVYDCSRCNDTYSKTLAMLIIGDGDGNGEVTIKDSKLFKQHILSGTFVEAFDLDFDGEVTMKDAKLLKKLLLGENLS